ncbi:hypothetical protein B0A52_02176 [Exophiala mesophila]|uniref:LsmAD domain-containing protein n=1 Tax=Exophiala mesophila TaxID=212818 RepID=A0A438NBM2_EXOME|nr:hypothetical protein B0A52_02176 [Exophiala mesophila]
MRSNNNAKAADQGRKQSPVDGAPRRPITLKAWGSGTNSFSQRTAMATQQNGTTPQPRNMTNNRLVGQKDQGISDKQAHERLSFILAAAIGLTIVVTVKNGDRFEGLLSGSNPQNGFSKITLKMVRKSHAAQGNGSAFLEAAFIGASPDHALNVDIKEITDVSIPEFATAQSTKAANGSSSAFQTDADISGNQNRGERLLQRWVPEGPDTTDFSLEQSASSGTWDQFAVNNQLFGAKSTYDESLYTTTIDRTAPSYKSREAEAERLAREIEGTSSTIAHVREERGQATGNDGEDEEDKYSGVRRETRTFQPLLAGATNKYTPPARRAPTGQATVPGAPIDPAIISSQLAPPQHPRTAPEKPEAGTAQSATTDVSAATLTEATTTDQKPSTTNLSAQPKTSIEDTADKEKDTEGQLTRSADPTGPTSPGPTENVEVKVLNQFRQFADAEKQRVIERRKAQANQDRTAKLNELLRFSKTFKLKTPIPTDLIGILAKDPVKQEAIVERAQKEHDGSSTSASARMASPVASPHTSSPRKVDAPVAQPSLSDRQTFNRTRGGFPPNGRPDRPLSQQQTMGYPNPRNNGANYPPRFPSQQGGKTNPSHPLPAPIPLIGGRVPPAGPLAEQNGVRSPQRSTAPTPNSVVSNKFNLNVKASEFRPNAGAATFSPSGTALQPSSPNPAQRTSSVSRTASPSAFFAGRKPKPPTERPSLSQDFNAIVRMKGDNDRSDSKSEEPFKDYTNNGGIPNAFQTGPRWTVRDQNDQKTYEEAFARPGGLSSSPAQAGSGPAQHPTFPGQPGVIPSGPSNIPHISTPQHGHHGAPHHYPPQYEDAGHRIQFGSVTSGVYPSPSLASRQTSAYASPMNHHAQLVYPQSQPYYRPAAGQMPMQVQHYPGTPGMMHAQVGQMGPQMMVQQASSGPYMGVPPQFGPQVHMYSPSSGHVHPQQNGFASPQRVAPAMMQQGSQQGYPVAPPMMYSMSGQGGPSNYQQQHMNGPRGGYGGHHYGAAQGYTGGHRTMSTGYSQIPQKNFQHQQNHGPQPNGPPHGVPYNPLEGVQDDGKH